MVEGKRLERLKSLGTNLASSAARAQIVTGQLLLEPTSVNGDKLSWSDDAPKTNPWLHDKLGFRSFSEKLARVIQTVAAPNGYVIGLQGPWGSGKSTAINFVRSFLERDNQDLEDDKNKIAIVDFRPWIVSGHDDLVSSYFKVLTESALEKPTRWQGIGRRSARLAQKAADQTAHAAAALANSFVPMSGAAVGIVSNTLSKSLTERIDEWLADPSMQTAYLSLFSALKKRPGRILVIVDDIDRLQEGEVRTLLQMVKTVGCLPNVVYLLAYDRGEVLRAFGGRRDGAASFLEKIVQHEAELPRPSRTALLAILDSRISFLPEAPANSLRWHYLLENGFHRWIRQPRDANRLANAVQFSWSALKGEIDPQDLLVMEGVRLFDTAVFEWIRNGRDYFFSEGRFLMAPEDQRNTEASKFTSTLPDDRREQVVELLCALFPQRSANLAHPDRSVQPEEDSGEVVARRGIGSEAGYDAYFCLFPSSNFVSKADVDAIASGMVSSQGIFEIFDAYCERRDDSGQALIGSMLSELRARMSIRHGLEPTEQLLLAILLAGDKILGLPRRYGMLEISPQANFSFLVGDILKSWGAVKASEKLADVFDQTNSPLVLSTIYVDRARELGLVPTASQSAPVITREGLDLIGDRTVRVIEENARNGSLGSSSYYWPIVVAWKAEGGPNAPRAWINSQLPMSDGRFLAKLAKGLTTITMSSTPPRYSLREMPDPEVFDLRLMRDAAERVLKSQPDADDDAAVVQALADGIDRFDVGDGAPSPSGESDL